MTTNEEFMAAIKLINSCKATLVDGCEHDQEDADDLYFVCKQYIRICEKGVK